MRRDTFSGKSRLVYGAASLEHNTIHRNVFARSDNKFISLYNLCYVNLCFFSFSYDHDILPAGSCSEEELLALAFSLEQKSEHPLAKAVIAAAQEKGIQAEAVEEFAAAVGNGLSGILQNPVNTGLRTDRFCGPLVVSG